MLKVTKNIEITGTSIFEEKTAAGYSAKINSNDPTDMTLTNWIADKDSYKTNRTQCYAERETFEDEVYALQAELIAEKAATETTE